MGRIENRVMIGCPPASRWRRSPAGHARHPTHIDLSVPHDQAKARIAAAWVTLADPEDNKVDIATWQGRD